MTYLLCTTWRYQAHILLGELSTWERKMNVVFFARIVAKFNYISDCKGEKFRAATR